MTTIASKTSANYLTPLQPLQKEVAAEVSSGQVSSSDATALAAALKDIDSSLQQGAGSSADSGSAKPSGDLKSKIDDLIAGEVSAGKLTTDQATELKTVFAGAFGGGPGGAGAPPSDSADATTATVSTSSADSTTSSDTSTQDLLQQFIELLQQAQVSSPTSYSASGDSGGGASGKSSSALVLDFRA